MKIHLEQMLANIDKTVTQHFKTLYKEGDMSKGKNLIIFEITKRYVHNFIKKELECVEAGDQIKIISLEKEVNTTLLIPELNFPVRLKGTVDRIDECNGTLRIIDYKTGKVIQSKVEIVNWEDLTTDYDKYSKSFQVLAYAYMLNTEIPFTTPVEAGIISFKNLQGDYFLKFAKKDKAGNGATKDQVISSEILDAYFIELKTLILEICNPEVDFVEKEV
jgi:ATP-dependent helicase/nuclease subunit B